MTISISERAQAALKELDVGGPNFLRISVVPGGCSGMTYDASIDSTLNENDETIHNDGGIRVVVETGSAMFLDNLEIDYSDDLVKSGFQFRNPNAAKACGCGSSFQT